MFVNDDCDSTNDEGCRFFFISPWWKFPSVENWVNIEYSPIPEAVCAYDRIIYSSKAVATSLRGMLSKVYWKSCKISREIIWNMNFSSNFFADPCKFIEKLKMWVRLTFQIHLPKMTPNKINLENDMNRREHPRKCGARIFNKDYDKILYINLPYIKFNNPKASTSSAYFFSPLLPKVVQVIASK